MATHEAGSDGTINGKLVEGRTIAPEKASNRALVESHSDAGQPPGGEAGLVSGDAGLTQTLGGRRLRVCSGVIDMTKCTS
jgi:hypothetical protein